MSTNLAQEWLLSFNDSVENNQSTHTHQAKTICVTGGKGGVGKTSIALKMALELSGVKKVLLIDCDHNLSNTSIKLGLPLQNDFFHLLKGTKDFGECVYSSGNFHLLAGCNGEEELIKSGMRMQDFVIDIMQSYQNDFDYIILDSPAGVNEHTLDLARYCDDRLFVVTPDKSSITDAYSLMKLLKTRHQVSENHLIANKVNDRVQYSRVIKTISETAESFLQTRTIILGSLANCSYEVDNFDREFLTRKNNLLHKSFLKIVEKYTEKIDDTSLLSSKHMMKSVSAEQEVQGI